MGGQFYQALWDFKLSPTTGELSQIRGLKFTTLFWGGDNRVFTGQKFFIPPTKEIHPSRLPPPTKLLFPPSKVHSTQPTKFNFSIEIFFSEWCHDIKNALIYKVTCNLKLPLNSMKLAYALFFLNMTESGMSQALFILYCLLKTMKLLNKCVIYYFSKNTSTQWFWLLKIYKKSLFVLTGCF